MPPQLEETLQRYLTAMAATLRPNTIDGYRTAVGSLMRYLGQHHPEIVALPQLRRTPHVVGWLNFLATKTPPYSIDTRRHYLFDLRNFFERLHAWDWNDAPPTGLLTSRDLPRANRHLPRPLTPELDAALQQRLRNDGDLMAQSLLLARFTGLRIGELQRLEQNCVVRSESGQHTLRVPLGKLHEERMIPLDDATAALVDELRRRAPDRPTAADPATGHQVRFLLADALGRPFHLDKFRRRLRLAAEAAGIKERVYPHRLRHTYATDLLRNGVSLPGLMRLLGHQSVAMTLRYVDVAPDDLARAYLAASKRSHERYATLTLPPALQPSADDPAGGILTRFDDLVGRLQQLRFDQPDGAGRRSLQRLVERLRRARADTAAILALEK